MTLALRKVNSNAVLAALLAFVPAVVRRARLVHTETAVQARIEIAALPQCGLGAETKATPSSIVMQARWRNGMRPPSVPKQQHTPDCGTWTSNARQVDRRQHSVCSVCGEEPLEAAS